MNIILSKTKTWTTWTPVKFLFASPVSPLSRSYSHSRSLRYRTCSRLFCYTGTNLSPCSRFRPGYCSWWMEFFCNQHWKKDPISIYTPLHFPLQLGRDERGASKCTGVKEKGFFLDGSPMRPPPRGPREEAQCPKCMAGSSGLRLWVLCTGWAQRPGGGAGVSSRSPPWPPWRLFAARSEWGCSLSCSPGTERSDRWPRPQTGKPGKGSRKQAFSYKKWGGFRDD